MTKEEQAEKRKGEILSAALDLFIHKGYYGASTRQISQKAGISSGLMFHYFADKDTLYCELITMATQRMRLSKGDEKVDAEQYLSRVVSTVFELLEKDPFFAKLFVFINQAQHTEGIPDMAGRMLETGNLLSACTALIKKGQRDGQFKAGKAETLALTFLCAIEGIALEKVRTPDMELPETNWVMDIVKK